jgi:hypothetical protein
MLEVDNFRLLSENMPYRAAEKIIHIETLKCFDVVDFLLDPCSLLATPSL